MVQLTCDLITRIIAFKFLNFPAALNTSQDLNTARLLQASGAAPAVDVTFAVALPAASRNSLLVVQSASPVVRAQFAGWFVYAMGGQGYDVNAEITSISAQVHYRCKATFSVWKPGHGLHLPQEGLKQSKLAGWFVYAMGARAMA